mmetsp:Transcript_6074/g.20443  ORF Transcript_6074/g.20443 Transcript_6074/m.20443 type:complete len:236 (-) Transcript_6074:496-1203(-)
MCSRRTPTCPRARAARPRSACRPCARCSSAPGSWSAGAPSTPRRRTAPRRSTWPSGPATRTSPRRSSSAGPTLPSATPRAARARTSCPTGSSPPRRSCATWARGTATRSSRRPPSSRITPTCPSWWRGPWWTRASSSTTRSSASPSSTRRASRSRARRTSPRPRCSVRRSHGSRARSTCRRPWRTWTSTVPWSSSSRTCTTTTLATPPRLRGWTTAWSRTASTPSACPSRCSAPP